jgi:hypothetical protein
MYLQHISAASHAHAVSNEYAAPQIDMVPQPSVVPIIPTSLPEPMDPDNQVSNLDTECFHI